MNETTQSAGMAPGTSSATMIDMRSGSHQAISGCKSAAPPICDWKCNRRHAKICILGIPTSSANISVARDHWDDFTKRPCFVVRLMLQKGLRGIQHCIRPWVTTTNGEDPRVERVKFDEQIVPSFLGCSKHSTLDPPANGASRALETGPRCFQFIGRPQSRCGSSD